MREQRRGAAFSLVELMVALVVMAIVVTRVMVAFTDQHENSLEQERVVDTQQSMRMVMDVILDDLRSAGFMVQRETGIASNDGGTAAADSLCVSNPDVLNPAEYADANDRFQSADITNTLTGNNSSIALSAGDLDIDGDGDDDFGAGGGVILSDGDTVHCASIVSITGSTLTIAPATPSGASFSPSTARAAPALRYSLVGNTLRRNGLVISANVDDLQVQFGVDEDNDGEIETAAGEFPIDDLDTFDTSRVRMARVHLTMRTAVPDIDFVGQRSGAANRVAASATDNFRRRKAIADTHLRNMR